MAITLKQYFVEKWQAAADYLGLTQHWLPIIRPEKFGAKRDGLTNDDEAFEAAVEALPEGGIIYLTNGEYRHDDTIRMTTKHCMWGEGFGTHLKYYGSGPAIAVEANGTIDPSVATGTAYSINLKSFKMTNYGPATKGVQYTGVVKGLLEDLAVFDFPIGIEVAGNKGESSYMCTFLDCWVNGPVCYHFKDYDPSYPPNNNQIIGGHIGCLGPDSIGIHQDSGSQLMVLHVTFEAAASCTNTPRFVKCDGGSYGVFLGNRFESGGAEGLVEFGSGSSYNDFQASILSNKIGRASCRERV